MTILPILGWKNPQISRTFYAVSASEQRKRMIDDGISHGGHWFPPVKTDIRLSVKKLRSFSIGLYNRVLLQLAILHRLGIERR